MNKSEELNYKLHLDRIDVCYKVDAKGRPYYQELFHEMISCIIDAELSTTEENRELRKALKVATIQMKIQDLENELDTLTITQ